MAEEKAEERPSIPPRLEEEEELERED